MLSHRASNTILGSTILLLCGLSVLTPRVSAAQGLSDAVAIEAGHVSTSQGAYCPVAGIPTEAKINDTIARLVVSKIQAAGYKAIYLQGTDLTTQVPYKGSIFKAYVALHMQPCLPTTESGFLVARHDGALLGSNPGFKGNGDMHDLLANTVITKYKSVTGFPRVYRATSNMTGYYGFHCLHPALDGNPIDPYTPAMLLEMGSLKWEWPFIWGNADLVAQTIAQGVIDFLRATNDDADDYKSLPDGSYGGAYASGMIGSASKDKDFYFFQGQAGSSVTLYMRKTATSGLDSYLCLYAPNGAYWCDDDGAGGRDSRISVQLPVSGYYKVTASSYNGQYTGSYTLSRIR